MSVIKYVAGVFGVLLPVVSAQAEGQAAPYPLLDGKCSEYQDFEASSYQLPHGVSLSVFQDDGYVWFCIGLPAESYGTLDMEVDAPGLSDPLNLHISAQLGEWPVSKPELMPETSTSDKWGKIDGWFGNVVAFNGEKTEGESTRVNYQSSSGRELQVSKEHFGRGTWKIRFELGLVRDSEGDFQNISYPASVAGESATLTVEVE